MFLRMIYSCPPTTPLPALRTSAGMLSLETRVWLEKVCLTTRILHTREEEENHCREVLEEQLEQGWPGLTSEVQDICSKVGLPDATKSYLNRKEVVKCMEYHSMKVAKEEMGEKKKCQNLKRKDLRKMQSYMLKKSLSDSRIEFLWQTDMLDSKTTMKGKYQKDQYWCPHCVEGRSIGCLESPAHFLVCSVYLDLRHNKSWFTKPVQANFEVLNASFLQFCSANIIQVYFDLVTISMTFSVF